MAIGKPEKICPHAKPGKWKRHAKRTVHKRRRQAERHNPEEAPKRPGYYGWSD